MKLNKDFSTLVIVGGWNRFIFTLNWVGKYLLPNEQLTLELNPQTFAVRISSKDVRIALQENKLSFIPVENRDNNFDRIQEIALHLADHLPHTPVSGYGVNFLFSGPRNDNLRNLIKPEDLSRIEEFGASLNSEKYTRRLTLKDRTLNFSIELKDSEAIFDFNFHFSISDLTEFKGKICDSPILELKQEAVNFMAEIYELELEEKDSK